jgi:tRNA(fMet)-specific endonuclease VapC
MDFLLDTNICIYIIKKKPSQVLQKFQSLPSETVAVSSLTVAELKYGVYKSQFPERNQTALSQFLSPLQIIKFNEDAADYYGKIRADLEKRGQVIGAMDILIAAHALSLDIILVTNNSKEFSRIPHLKIENWLE